MNFILNTLENKNLLKIFLFTWIISIPFKNSIYHISVFLLIIYFFLHIAITKKIHILLVNAKKTITLTIGFFLLILCMHISNFSNLNSIDIKSWYLLYMFIIRYSLIFVLLSYFYKLNFFEKKELVQWLFCSFFALALTGVYQLIIEPNILLGQGIQGTLSNRNAFGLFVGMGFVLSLFTTLHYKTLGFFILTLFLVLMMFSFSRSSWVASFISSLLFIALNYKVIKLKHFLYFIFLVGLLLFMYFYFDAFQYRLDQLAHAESSDRTRIWIRTIVFIKEKFYFGYGLDSFKYLPDISISQHRDPHNMFLEILISIGIIGFIISLFTIIVILLRIYQDKNYLLYPIAAYFLIVTQFDFGAFASKELLSFLTIFVFYVYADHFRQKI